MIKILFSLGKTDSRVCNFAYQTVQTDVHENYHSHDYIKIMRVVSGSAEWTVEGNVHILSEGDIILLNSNERRKIDKVIGNTELILEWIQFTPMAVYPTLNCTAVFYQRPSDFNHVICKTDSHFAVINFFFGEISRNAHGHDILREEAILSNLRSMLIEVTRCYAMPMPDSSFVSERNFQIITETLSYTEEHFAEPLTEQTFANRFYISRSYFSRLFHAYYGIGFNQYLRRCRLTHTAELLRHNDMTVLDAAFACGFTSASGFYKTLRALTGNGKTREQWGGTF